MSLPGSELAGLQRRGVRLEYGSVAWMAVEAAIALTAGIVASSIALTGFGLDSVLELLAAFIVVWQLRGGRDDRETRAVRLIGVTFLALATYLVVQSVSDLATYARPGHSVAGLVVAAAALVVMPGLAVAKRRAGQALGSRALPTLPRPYSVPLPQPPPCSASAFLAEAAFAARVPAGISPFEAAPLTCAGVTTYKAVKADNVRPADLVAISGIGGLWGTWPCSTRRSPAAPSRRSTSPTRNCSWPRNSAPTS